MGKLIKIIIVLSFVTPMFLQAQAVTWQKWYDYNNYDNDANTVIQTLDGGYLFLGNNYVPFNYSSILIKTDEFGTIQWKKLIDQNLIGSSGITCLALQQTNDSGFVIAGYTNDSALLFSTYSNGVVNWVRKYGSLNHQTTFSDCKVTFDGGFILCGESYPPPPLDFGFILKTDSKGNEIWEKKLSTYYNKIIQSKDSSFYLGQQYQILKVSKTGEEVWRVNPSETIGPYVVEDSKGYIYTGGYPKDTMILYKLNSSGDIIWRNGYYPTAHAQCMCLSNSGNSILMAGYIDTLIQGNITVSKVDLDGNLIFSKQIYSAFGIQLDFLPYAISPTSDDGFILTGYTNYPRFTSYHDNILGVKTDSMCNAPLMVGIQNNSSITYRDFIIYQNYPNPFNPVTTISYILSKANHVTISIYNNLGEKISILVNSKQSPGKYSVQFNGDRYSSGIYFFKVDVDTYTQTKKMILLK